MSAEERFAGVRAKAALLDPATMSVVWSNDPAFTPGISLEELMPLGPSIGAPEALQSVSASGEPAHLQAGVVTTSRGSVDLVVSIYRLPDGRLLLLSEHGWQAAQRERGSASAGRPRRRSR